MEAEESAPISTSANIGPLLSRTAPETEVGTSAISFLFTDLNPSIALLVDCICGRYKAQLSSSIHIPQKKRNLKHGRPVWKDRDLIYNRNNLPIINLKFSVFMNYNLNVYFLLIITIKVSVYKFTPKNRTSTT